MLYEPRIYIFFFRNIYSCITEHVAELFSILSFSSHTERFMFMYFEHGKWKTFHELQVWHSKTSSCLTLNRKWYCLWGAKICHLRIIDWKNSHFRNFIHLIELSGIYHIFRIGKENGRLKETCPITCIFQTLQMLLTHWQSPIFYSVSQWILFFAFGSLLFFYSSLFPGTFAAMSHFNDIMVNHSLS